MSHAAAVSEERVNEQKKYINRLQAENSALKEEKEGAAAAAEHKLALLSTRVVELEQYGFRIQF